MTDEWRLPGDTSPPPPTPMVTFSHEQKKMVATNIAAVLLGAADRVTDAFDGGNYEEVKLLLEIISISGMTLLGGSQNNGSK